MKLEIPDSYIYSYPHRRPNFDRTTMGNFGRCLQLLYKRDLRWTVHKAREMEAPSFKDLTMGRWGGGVEYCTHKVYERLGVKSPFRLHLRTDFALHDLYASCFACEPIPYVKELPNSNCFKLVVLFHCPLDMDLLEVVRRIQRLAGSEFFAGHGLDWRCILSTVHCDTEVHGRVVFPDIILHSLAALTSF